MTAQTLERDHQAPPATTRRYDQPDPVSLRTDFYLIAHDRDTGQPHQGTHTVAVGLAAAVLLELWHAGRVRIGWHSTARHGTSQRTPGQITLLDATPTKDPITNAALTLLRRLGGTVHTRRFIAEFATTDLYHQVRDHLITTGVLRTITRRKFWIFRTTTHLPTCATHPVRAHARVRNVGHLYNPRPQDITLAALVTALSLSPYLHLHDQSVGSVFLRLVELLRHPHPVRDVTNTLHTHRYQ